MTAVCYNRIGFLNALQSRSLIILPEPLRNEVPAPATIALAPNLIFKIDRFSKIVQRANSFFNYAFQI
jgi:hypothetical protein